ncbi:hypothetical protein M0812_28225 [Anaeramoeba flamelloides]|uniref:Uncharacterized protein n=1 Tax=Anaeramoeba flamelloides TaxID=1746091 RepID=A0AAV7YAY0_9EUKA|nr:hypothetical protein M0812_28225 [Anaeramoeba flamelloides]
MSNNQRRTINQKRLENLLGAYPNSVHGLTQEILLLPNAPKQVSLDKGIVGSTQLLTKMNLMAFMIKKYNLFPENEQAQGSRVLKFGVYAASGMDDLVKYSDSNKFIPLMSQISEQLRGHFLQNRSLFSGVDPIHLQNSYCVPSVVTIRKGCLRDYFEKSGDQNVEARVKKVYRGFSFFFKARYNLKNSTNKNRKIMKFGRYYTPNALTNPKNSKAQLSKKRQNNNQVKRSNTKKKTITRQNFSNLTNNNNTTTPQLTLSEVSRNETSTCNKKDDDYSHFTLKDCTEQDLELIRLLTGLKSCHN